MPEETNESSKDNKSRPEQKNPLGSMVLKDVKNAEPQKKPEEQHEQKANAKEERKDGESKRKDNKSGADEPKTETRKLKGNHEERVTHTVTFDLTEEEFAFKGKEAARLQGEINLLDREFQSVKEEHKSRTSLLEMECESTLSIIRRGKEEREVTCTKIIDFDKGLVEFLFQNKLVETRGIKPDERQGKFF